MAEFNIKVTYRPGVENIPADILSRYGMSVDEGGNVPTTLHRLADPSVEAHVREWLCVVASHIKFAECVTGAVEALSRGLNMASYPCNKCGGAHLDVG